MLTNSRGQQEKTPRVCLGVRVLEGMIGFLKIHPLFKSPKKLRGWA